MYTLSLCNLDQNKHLLLQFSIGWSNFSLLDLGYAKHTLGESQMVLIIKGTLFPSGMMGKLHIQVFCATVSIV